MTSTILRYSAFNGKHFIWASYGSGEDCLTSFLATEYTSVEFAERMIERNAHRDDSFYVVVREYRKSDIGSIDFVGQRKL